MVVVVSDISLHTSTIVDSRYLPARTIPKIIAVFSIQGLWIPHTIQNQHTKKTSPMYSKTDFGLTRARRDSNEIMLVLSNQEAPVRHGKFQATTNRN
jgi:hypothetical protein